MTVPGAERLVRDRPTLTLYTGFVMWGWLLYGFSPAVPLIAAEQGISRAQAGLHGTAMAVGTVLAGAVTAQVAARLGRRVQVVLGCAVVVVGLGVLMVGRTLPVTLAAVLVAAVGGNLILSAAQPGLVVHHRRTGAAAVTEANAMGSGFGLLAPLAVGASVALGWGWRPAVAVAAVLALLLAVLVLRLPGTGALGRGAPTRRVAGAVTASGTLVGAAPEPSPRTPRGFGLTFHLFLVALLCGVAIEFSTTFWAPDLLVQRAGADPSLATASVSALVLGMTAARLVVGPMAVRRAPEKLLLVAYVVAGIGFGVLWTATHPAVAVAGLVVAGLGYGAHYPLAVSLVLRAGGERPDQAQARSTIGAGIAIGLAPFVLGAAADAVGTHAAFLLVPVLLAGGFVAVALGLRSVRRSSTTSRST